MHGSSKNLHIKWPSSSVGESASLSRWMSRVQVPSWSPQRARMTSFSVMGLDNIILQKILALLHGRVPKWSTGAGRKPAAFGLQQFESTLSHQQVGTSYLRQRMPQTWIEGMSEIKTMWLEDQYHLFPRPLIPNGRHVPPSCGSYSPGDGFL